MIIKFRQPWIWGGGSHTGKKSEKSNMRRFRVHPKGVEVPDALFPFLPSDAKILKGPKDKKHLPDIKELEVHPNNLDVNTLQSFDTMQQAGDMMNAVAEKASKKKAK